jgi:hypothetical protein
MVNEIGVALGNCPLYSAFNDVTATLHSLLEKCSSIELMKRVNS